ncbi:DoxX family protein [Phytomonospora sp. NPDC050363]|uniref:DoxX family protein n=1 Tax=Phytomonospora sp. NPDC050363 TaxID=3155642 RepID=UPI0033CFB0BD
MHTVRVAVTLTAAANAFSGIAALLHWKAILPGMAKADVPETWLTFPIGTLKTAGAAGLLAGLWVPWMGTAAASGLVLFFVCAVYTHIRASDFGAQFWLAIGFLALAAASLRSAPAPWRKRPAGRWARRPEGPESEARK